MCGVLRSAHHTLTNSSAEYQVLHAQYYKSRVVKRDFSVKNMADETEDSVVVVAGLLLAKKKKDQNKTTMEKVMETARVYALQRELEVSKNRHR